MEQLPNLLIVDDNRDNLYLLEIIIRETKVNLIQALSGFEALEKTRGIKLALAIIDVNLPGLNGYELALKINEERPDEKVPVIFMTANYIQEKEVLKGYDFGAVDYIFEPFAGPILLSKINVFLDLYNQKQTIIRDALLLKKTTLELKRANAALRKSELKYRSYIDNAPDGVFVADEKGRYIEANDAACRMTGYSKKELLTMSVTDMLPVESLEEGLAHFRKLAKEGISKGDLIFRHKNGTKRWWTVESVKLTETRFLGFTKDITERKMADEELENSLSQLHQLTQYIEQVRENERIAISRELHDDLGQALTAVIIDLRIIRQNVSDPKVILKIDKVSALVGDTIHTVQQLTSQLRPSIIDDLGLEAAIEWYTKEFAERNNIEVALEIDSEIDIPAEASLNLFRIVQESLTNISRHSKATHIDIGLHKTLESVCFIISDNGIGISDNEINSKKSFGIMSMRERARSLGGVFDIYRENGHRTTIKLIIPLNE